MPNRSVRTKENILFPDPERNQDEPLRNSYIENYINVSADEHRTTATMPFHCITRSTNSYSGFATSAETFLAALSLHITVHELQLHDGNGPWRVRFDPSRDKVNPV